MLLLQSTPLNAVLDQMSLTLGVPRQRLLLLREEAELPVDATVGDLDLSITDIIGESRDLVPASEKTPEHER